MGFIVDEQLKNKASQCLLKVNNVEAKLGKI